MAEYPGTFHPSVEALLAHHDGGLSAEDARRIEEHCVRCPSCREQKAELERFLEPVAADLSLDETDAEAMWAHISAARAAGLPPTNVAEEREPGSLHFWEAPLAPMIPWYRRFEPLQALAACLLLTTLVFAAAWLAVRHRAVELAGAEINVPIESLEASTFLRGGGGARTVSPGAVLILTPAHPPADGDHTAEILTADGETVWSGHGLRPTSRESFHLRLPRSLRPGGTFRLRIRAAGGEEEMSCLITIEGTD